MEIPDSVWVLVKKASHVFFVFSCLRVRFLVWLAADGREGMKRRNAKTLRIYLTTMAADIFFCVFLGILSPINPFDTMPRAWFRTFLYTLCPLMISPFS